jgi:single-stranded DNA-binding protein
MIEGELQHSDYTGQDGIKRYKTEVVVNNFEFLNTLPKSQPAEPKNDYAQPTPVDDLSQPEPREEEEIRVENIPF